MGFTQSKEQPLLYLDCMDWEVDKPPMKARLFLPQGIKAVTLVIDHYPYNKNKFAEKIMNVHVHIVNGVSYIYVFDVLKAIHEQYSGKDKRKYNDHMFFEGLRLEKVVNNTAVFKVLLGS